MLVESPSHPVTAHLERNFETFREEAGRLSEADYAPWPQEGSFVGAGWKVHCLHSRDPEWVMAHTSARNRRLCPHTTSLLSRLPGLVRGGFSMLLPQTHILEHVDGGTEDTLRCHLGIFIPPEARFRLGGRTVAWQEGRSLLFDGTFPHEAANHGETPRVVLLVDIERRVLQVGARP